MSNAVVLVACLAIACSSKKEAPPQAEPTPTEPAAPAQEKKMTPAPPPVADTGSCVIKGTGAATFEQTTPGGRAAVNVWHWVEESERRNVAAFILNCAGKDSRITFTARKQAEDALPAFGPKQYVFAKTGNELSVIGMVQNEIFRFIEGTLDITAFDATRIAGTFSLTGKVEGGKEQTVTGTFDYPCPGYSRCAK
jgi:hypothetical protein